LASHHRDITTDGEAIHADQKRARARVPASWRRRLPPGLKDRAVKVLWVISDLRDFLVETVGWLPSHTLRIALYRLLGAQIGRGASIHRGCRMYAAPHVHIGAHSVINRDVLLDGRMGLEIGSNVSISEGAFILTLEHNPNSSDFGPQGGRVAIGDRAFIGARATILPGVTLGEGSVVAAGAVVTVDVVPFCIVAGVPARPVAERSRDLSYTLNYRKFLG